MDQIVHEVRSRNWASIITECRQSTLTKLEWCRQNGINIKSFYYWQRKLRNEAMLAAGSIPATTAFAEVSVQPQKPDITSDGVAAVLHKSDMHIEIMNTVSEDFLIKLVRSLSHA